MQYAIRNQPRGTGDRHTSERLQRGERPTDSRHTPVGKGREPLDESAEEMLARAKERKTRAEKDVVLGWDRAPSQEAKVYAEAA